MMRWLATLVLLALLGLAVFLPQTQAGRRGHERTVRAHVPEVAGWVGQPLPELGFEDLDGRPVRTADLLGHPLLLVFERSVDW